MEIDPRNSTLECQDGQPAYFRKAARGVIFGNRESCADDDKDRTWVQGLLSVDYIHTYFHGRNKTV